MKVTTTARGHYGFNCDSDSTGFRRKDNPQDIELPAGDAAAMKAACCIGPTCTGNGHSSYFQSTDFYDYYDNNNGNMFGFRNFQCGTGKHARPSANTTVISGADTAAKQAVCCDDDVYTCSGNDRNEFPTLNMNSKFTTNNGERYNFVCAGGHSLKPNASTIVVSGADAAAENSVCCIGPTCTGNTPATGADYSYFGSNVDFFQHYDYNNGNPFYNFQCGTGKHAKPNGNTIVVSGADTGAKQAVCCDDDVAGMCSGNTLPDYPNGLSYGTPAGCDEKGEREGICASFQYRCGDHSQLKSTSASIALSGATVAEKYAVCCEPTTPANAAFFDKCSTITTKGGGTHVCSSSAGQAVPPPEAGLVTAAVRVFLLVI